MIRITKQADYGIVLLTHLAGDPAGQHSAPELAEVLRIALPMVSKILKLLTKDGLLISHRGVNGGYGLARPPQEITVDRIIHALEGPIAMTECIDDEHHDCSRESFCAVRGNWQVINRAIQTALESITLADMTRPLPGPASGLVRLGGHRAVAAEPAAAR